MLETGRTYDAVFEVFDHEGDPLTFRWEVKPESESNKSGGDREEPLPNLEGVLSDSASARTGVKAPAPGRYRLFAYAYDGQGHAAHANIPFLVE